MEDNTLIENKNNNNIIDILVMLIVNANIFSELSGLAKREFVINELINIIGNEYYILHYTIIQQNIDFLVKLGKGQVTVDFKNIKKNLFKCCLTKINKNKN